jgi:pre-mRNA-splicing factor CWC26
MSSSRSKVEYLTNKYALDTDRGQKKEKKKEKKRSKYDVGDENPNETRRVRRDLRLYDADHLENLDVDASRGRNYADDDSDEGVNEEEDAPIVVDSSELMDPNIGSSEHVPRGAWEVQSLDAADGIEKRTLKVQSGRARRRYDSSSDDDDPPPRRRRDSDDANHISLQGDSRRRRHDTDSDDSSDRQIAETVTSRPKRRHDSFNSDSSSRRRHHRRKRHDSSDDSDKEAERSERMSSGHRSGIQTGQDFSRREKRLQQTKREVTQAFVEKHGGTGETVHRDRASGTIIDAKQQTAKRDHKVVLSAEEQRKLNVGQAQLEREAQAKSEFAALQEASFARGKDDADLDTMLKSVIHPDDPMAAYAMEQKQKQTSGAVDREDDTTKVKTRPLYKGPPAKPNRFGIPPGYRWDARDRGNGFEDKVLAQKYNAQHQKEKAYRYSSADM